jgi:hypothetical protein
MLRTYGKRARAPDAGAGGAFTPAPAAPLRDAASPPATQPPRAAASGSLASFLGLARAPLAPVTANDGAPRGGGGGSGAAASSTQLHIDLGQRVFDSAKCRACGMIFCPGDASDERAHARACGASIGGGGGGALGGAASVPPPLAAWPAARGDDALPVLARAAACALGGIVVVRASAEDAAGTSARGAALRTRLAAELGARSAPPRGDALLFVALAGGGGGGGSGDARVAGALVATRLAPPEARRVRAEGGAPGGPPLALAVPRGAPRERALLAVAQVWVAPGARRAGVARALLDGARAGAIYACSVPVALVAFANPTADGWRLAASYCGRADVLVTDGGGEASPL